jgi:uncharacterized protein YbcI
MHLPPGLNLLFRADDTSTERRGGKRQMAEGSAPERAVDGSDPRNSVRAEISREMVRIYKEQFGRGPTRARTEFAGTDIVVCTLEESFTPAERRLVEMGEHQRLRDLRLYFQHATEEQFCEVIERLLKRKVRSFVSGLDVTSDLSTELFYLEP